MNKKRWLEIGSGLLLFLTLAGSIGGYSHWKVRRDRATRELIGAMEAYDPQAIRDAVLHGADVRVRTNYRGGPMNVAAVRDDLELLRLLHEHGADPNARDSRGMTPLLCQPSFRTAELLLSYGADPNATDTNGRSALTNLALSGDQESVAVARLLMEHGAKPRPVDLDAARKNAGMTALLKGTATKR